jgi:hypothetical protein
MNNIKFLINTSMWTFYDADFAQNFNSDALNCCLSQVVWVIHHLLPLNNTKIRDNLY